VVVVKVVVVAVKVVGLVVGSVMRNVTAFGAALVFWQFVLK
jgi:hypothetical protein